MNRRDFLAISVGGLLLPDTEVMAAPRTSSVQPYSPPDIFPPSASVEHLHVAPLVAETVDQRQLYICLQGLINRKKPRIYFTHDETDELWLEYYGKTYGVTSERVEHPSDLLKQFAAEVDGFIVYDPQLPDTRNVATAIGSLHNALPIPPQFSGQLQAVGLKQLDDLRGRWPNRYEAYRWVLEEIFPRMNHRIVGTNCVDQPHWPSHDLWVDDYFIAHKVFSFDLSASRRDRIDRQLIDEIYSELEKPACLMGWRSARNVEHEMVGFAARRGLFVLCALHALNLTVHTAIPKSKKPFRQHHMTEDEVGPVEKKIYISLMNTDGDSLASMLRLQTGRFLEPDHGRLPYTWGYLPLAYDLLPGVARYNYEKLKENDYFAASTCGAAYTYPHLLPDARSYLRYSQYYMEKTDLRTAYMANWDDDFWWQEMETPGFLEAMREEMPGALGFVRGMGESAFEPHFLDGGAPYIFCGEGIHSNSDVYSTIKEFVAANTIRPLFIYLLVNHSTTLRRIHEAVDRLPTDDYEFVRLDAFIHLLAKARRQGLIGKDLYPDKRQLRKLLARDAVKPLANRLKTIQKHALRAELDVAAFIREADDPKIRLILDRTATPPSDIIAFDAAFDSMHLVRLALNLKGVYVNSKAKGVNDFLNRYGHVVEAEVVREIWMAWEAWDQVPVSYAKASAWARRLDTLASGVATEAKVFLTLR